MSLRDHQVRTAARKAAGADQTYPHHAAKTARASAPVRVALLVVSCAHEGDIITPCHSCGSEQRHVRDCSVHGTCTRVDAGKDVDQVCERCSSYQPRRSASAEAAVKFAGWPPPPPPLPPL